MRGLQCKGAAHAYARCSTTKPLLFAQPKSVLPSFGISQYAPEILLPSTACGAQPRSVAAVSTVDARGQEQRNNVSSVDEVLHDDEGPVRDFEAEVEELMKLVSLLPPGVRAHVEEHPQMTELLEVVMDLGRPPIARFPTGDVKLSEDPITQADLDYAVQQVGEFGGDNRAGIDRTLHRISAMRNRAGRIIGLTCRVGRAIRGSAKMVADLVQSGASILFLGRPGVGKTTAIREVSRSLADDLQRRVVIVDTSNEIGGDGDIPHAGIGRARRMQVPDPEAQHRVMIEAVENHMPEVVVIDEIGTEAECAAARTIAQRGVQLVATAHGNELDNVIKNPALSDLVGSIQSVTLGDEEARKRGVQKSILERGGPPTFDVAVEIIERAKWRVHLDVAHAVDLMLAGGQAGGQVRERAADGTILRYNYNPLVSGVLSNPTRDLRSASGAGASTSGQAQAPQKSPPMSARAARAAAAAALAAQEKAEAAAASTSTLAAITKGPAGGVGAAAGAALASGGMTATWSRSSQDSYDDMEQLAEAAVPHAARAGSSSSSSFVRPSVHQALEAAAAEEDAEAGDDGVDPQEGARRLASRQALMGVDPESVVLRLFPYELDADKLWEVMTAMDLVDKVLIVRRVSAADAVLGLRAKVKADSSLRQAAKEARVPIYAVKAGGATNLVRGLRTLLGMDPSAGGSFVRTSAAKMEGDDADAAAAGRGTLDALEDGAGPGPVVAGSLRAEQDIASLRARGQGGDSPSGLRLAALRAHEAATGEALEEARAACEQIVAPLGQPVELLPRPLPVLQEQIALVLRYRLGHEVVGGANGETPRLRILPAPKA